MLNLWDQIYLGYLCALSDMRHLLTAECKQKMMVAAIAPWFRLRLPSCGPGFESQAHYLCFFQFILLKLYQENNKNKQKEAGIGPYLKK